LVVICVEIATDHNAFNAGHCTSDHVMNVREELSNCDLTFLNVLRSLRLGATTLVFIL
jgi:hypothetical protein